MPRAPGDPRRAAAARRLPRRRGSGRQRFEEINDFERYLVDNGTIVSSSSSTSRREEQKRRFLERIDQPEKNWKFSVQDAKERAHWKDYMKAYEDVFTHTSTKRAPWYVIPADHKWFMRLAVAAITYQTLEDLDLKYPTVTDARKKELLQARKVLMAEKG